MEAFPVLILVLVLVLHLVPLLLLPEGGSEGEWPDQRTLEVGTTRVCWALTPASSNSGGVTEYYQAKLVFLILFIKNLKKLLLNCLRVLITDCSEFALGMLY